jgi:hypothetical protein
MWVERTFLPPPENPHPERLPCGQGAEGLVHQAKSARFECFAEPLGINKREVRFQILNRRKRSCAYSLLDFAGQLQHDRQSALYSTQALFPTQANGRLEWATRHVTSDARAGRASATKAEGSIYLGTKFRFGCTRCCSQPEPIPTSTLQPHRTNLG